MIDGFDELPAPKEQLGSILNDRYRLEAILGVGGQAAVFRAHDMRLQRDVAIKRNRGDIGRFRTEIEVLQRIRSTSATPVLDIGVSDPDDLWFVLPLYADTLAKRIVREGPIPSPALEEQAASLLEGLHDIHGAGVVHRDLKPANVLLDGSRWVLADFGIARDTAGHGNDTVTGQPLGTWEFMAPEQITDANTAGPRADLYAAGATIFHAATGQSALHLFHSSRDDARLGGLSEAVGDVVWRSTRLQIDRRYDDAAQMARALRAGSKTIQPSAGPRKNKICMLGASAVGKTSLVKRFVHSIFEDRYRTTIGVHIERKDVEVAGSTRTCVLWDLEGEDRWASTRKPMLRGAHGFIVVVDGTRRETAAIAQRLLNDARAVAGPQPYALFINKSDRLDEWTLTGPDLEPLVMGASSVFRTSARSGRDVDRGFTSLVRAIR